MNTDIHKSVSNFVIKAVIQYINDASRSSLTKSGKNEKEKIELAEKAREWNYSHVKEILQSNAFLLY